MTQRWELAGLLGVALLGGLIFAWFFPTFPVATVPIHVTEAEAGDISTAYLTERGYDVGASQQESSFYIDSRQSAPGHSARG